VIFAQLALQCLKEKQPAKFQTPFFLSKTEREAHIMLLRFVMCAAFAIALLATPSHGVETTSASRQAEVERRGAQVMPFSQELTLHIFTKTDSGGIQQVIVKDPSDTGQIRLIREHLSKISKEFAHGNFSDPAKIHGNGMPGLKELENAKPGQLRIEYKELPDGAQITYSSASPEMIEAVHRWFDAQLADHAGHAVSGHAGHAMEMK
jgi:hypothetical protein